jgi:cytidylate kinase
MFDLLAGIGCRVQRGKISRKQQTKGEFGMKTARVVAIDGPSGSGKSSTSKRVGAALGFLHVDSGALYRIMTWQCLEKGVDVQDAASVAVCALEVEVECRVENGAIAYYVGGESPGERIRAPEINASASHVAKVKEVRERVTSLLRDMTRHGDLVVEGRDITTAVFPDSPARFYLTASAEARAARRQKAEVEKGIANQSTEAVKESLLARDAIDSTRQHAPLRKADGALEIDSTDLTLDQVVELVLAALPADWRAGL